MAKYPLVHELQFADQYGRTAEGHQSNTQVVAPSYREPIEEDDPRSTVWGPAVRSAPVSAKYGDRHRTSRRRTVTEDEVLAKWRRQYGRITLPQARELQRLARKFAHLIVEDDGAAGRN